MSKLLHAGLARLFHNRVFQIGILISLIYGILLNVVRHLDIQKYPEQYAKLGAEYHSAEGFVFSGALYMMFLIAVIVVKLLGTEYSDGTIRNKIIAGHKRTNIFLANYGIGAVASLCMLLAFIATTLAVGKVLLPSSCLTAKELAAFTLSECASLLGLTAIFVTITMLSRSKSTAIAANLILTAVLFAAGMTISAKLSAEQYREYQEIVADAETGELITVTETIQNTDYLEGTKRVIYEQLNNFLPVNQVLQVMMFEKKNLVIMGRYSALLIVFCNGAGILIFRKMDLK